MPYKFIPSGKFKNEVKAPSFTREVKLSLTYAPELAVPFAEMDLLFSEPKKIQDKIERLAFAYLRAGEKEKAQNLLEQKINFVYPKIDWGILEDYISSKSYTTNDKFSKQGLKNVQYYIIMKHQKKQKELEDFNKSVILRKQRNYYLKLMTGNNIIAKSYGVELEKIGNFSKKHKKYIKMLYSKKGNSITFGLKENEIEKLNSYFDVIKKRINGLNLKVVDRYKEFSNEEIKEEFKHLTKILGTFSFFTVDIALYVLHERKNSDYIISPQSLLFVIVQTFREYKQKYRCIAMLYWMQKTGMNSIQTKPNSLYHDYFNAMEATIYLYKYLVEGGCYYFYNEKHYQHLSKFMNNSIKLAHDPLSKKYFLYLWQHRHMVTSYAWSINRVTDHLYKNIPMAKNMINNLSSHPYPYNDFARDELAGCYMAYKNYTLAEPIYTELVQGINYQLASPSQGCYMLTKIANITNNKELWKRTQNMAKKYIEFERNTTNYKYLKKLLKEKFNPKIIGGNI